MIRLSRLIRLVDQVKLTLRGNNGQICIIVTISDFLVVFRTR